MKINRTEDLIADFSDGYARGWAFYVGEWFKSSLDIEYSKRQKNNNEYYVWTQGRSFSFAEGEVVYLKGENDDNIAALQIFYANPAGLNETGITYDGVVSFDVLCLKDGKFSKSEQIFCTQIEFVELLKTGIFQGRDLANEYKSRFSN